MADYTISDTEYLNLERTRQKGVADLQAKNVNIPNNATINDVIDADNNLANVDTLIDGSYTGEFRNNRITNVKSQGLAYMPNITKVVFDEVTTAQDNIFLGDTYLEIFKAPKLTSIGGLANFLGTINHMYTIYLPLVTTTTGGEFLRPLTVLQKLITPKLNSIAASNFFTRASSTITLIDSAIPSFSFSNYTPSNVTTLIIRNTDSVPTLESANSFTNANLTIYITEDLISTLKSATNWSALPCMSNPNSVVALEGSDYEDEDWFESTDEYQLYWQ